MNKISLHHISATVRHPQEALDFYAGFLGLKLVKKTLNHDDKKTLHLYFGNLDNKYSTLLTLFAHPELNEGIQGGGQANEIIFTVPKGSLTFWKERFTQFKYQFTESNMFNKQTLQFKDRHGINLAIMETENDQLSNYEFNGITKKDAIIDLYAVKIASTDYQGTKEFLQSTTDLSLSNSNMFYDEYLFNDGSNKKLYLVRNNIPEGVSGSGTIHHIAFGVENETILESLNEKVLFEKPTKIRDRYYFKAIYVKEKGGNIIEFANNKPNFLIDESLEELGNNLIIPPHFEADREKLLKTIMPLYVNPIKEIIDYPYNDKYSHDLYYDHKKRLNRINELARKESLTEAEIEERAILRKEYIKTIREGFKSSLDSIEIEQEKPEVN